MLNKVIKGIQYRLSKVFGKLIGPKMISRKKNFQGKQIQGLRIGNSTFIDHSQNLVLEDYVYIGHHNFIEASNGIKISKGTQITSFITITSHSSHNSIRLYGSAYSEISQHIGYEKGSILIEEFTFVGPYTVIMPNTRIGKGCIVTAHSYLKGDFPDFSIISGNPAKVIGDVREKDNEWIKNYPELQKTYMK
jgi:acetyltransferase-like isoleucine patch superfamily enzyme